MNIPRFPSPVGLLAGAGCLVAVVAACGGGDDRAAPAPASSDVAAAEWEPPQLPPPVAGPCPSAAPVDGGSPQWTLQGATGSVAVTGSTDAAAPRIDVSAPFTVTETQVQTLQAGDGPVVADDASASVCYVGVNGRDGTVFDSSYAGGAPVDFPLDGVVAGFRKAIAGQTVGSTVGVAMVPADGYPQGQPAAGIEPGDTLIFEIKILAATP